MGGRGSGRRSSLSGKLETNDAMPLDIRKITRTMELIATARFKKALDRATEAEAYTRKIAELVAGAPYADREALAIDIDLSLPSERVVRSLDQIIEWRGKPQVIRSDNGPEYISGTFIAWAERRGIRLEHIQPGNPQQNAYIERYNRTVRYDWLSHYLFESIEEVQNYATDWMWIYNHERPNMALGGITPKQKSALLTDSTSDRR